MRIASPLVGRAGELSSLEARLDAASSGEGGALVVSGEVGVGKSCLLDHARIRAEAGGFRVLATAGAETETDLPFAGLHRLLQPVLSKVELLPDRQRVAMHAAFGLSEDQASDLFLVGLAALTLLVDLAAQSPLLVLVEDAHWLDRASLEVMAFLVRRVNDDRILLLAAVRDGSGADVGSLMLGSTSKEQRWTFN
jgi:predicted ATPase